MADRTQSEKENNRPEVLSCAECGQRLSDFLLGLTSAEETQRVERHLAECAQCRAELHELEQMVAALSNLPAVEPPKDFMTKLHARLQREAALAPVQARPSKLQTWKERLRSLPRGWRIGAPVLACVLALAVISTGIFRHMEHGSPIGGTDDQLPAVTEANQSEVRDGVFQSRETAEEPSGQVSERQQPTELAPAAESAAESPAKPVAEAGKDAASSAQNRTETEQNGQEGNPTERSEKTGNPTVQNEEKVPAVSEADNNDANAAAMALPQPGTPVAPAQTPRPDTKKSELTEDMSADESAEAAGTYDSGANAKSGALRSRQAAPESSGTGKRSSSSGGGASGFAGAGGSSGGGAAPTADTESAAVVASDASAASAVYNARMNVYRVATSDVEQTVRNSGFASRVIDENGTKVLILNAAEYAQMKHNLASAEQSGNESIQSLGTAEVTNSYEREDCYRVEIVEK